MPAGSEYQGPHQALELYKAAVEASSADSEVKGAKNPYTSRNGHMFSFLDADGTMALRLSDDRQEEFMAAYNSGPVTQYGSVMRGYVSVPEELLADTVSIASWFDHSYEWIGTLPPKPTKKA
jgi:hypothetical protein